MSSPQAVRTRKSAEARREEIIALAIEQFARSGYKGTSTDAIAREAGISQPYLFRLFKTKRELFLACHDVADGRVFDTFRAAAEGVPQDEVLAAMGRAYTEQLLADRTALLFEMQSYAACCRSRDPGARARELRQDREGGHAALGRAARGGLAVLLPRDAAERDRVARPEGDRGRGGMGEGLVRAGRDDPEAAG